MRKVYEVWLPMGRNEADRRSQILAAGDHRSDFNLIAVVQHFVFGDEIIAFDHQMRFDDEIQLAQEFLDLLGAFDLDGSGWMAQLDLHGRIISSRAGRGQGGSEWVRSKKVKVKIKKEEGENRLRQRDQLVVA